MRKSPPVQTQLSLRFEPAARTESAEKKGVVQGHKPLWKNSCMLLSLCAVDDYCFSGGLRSEQGINPSEHNSS